MASSGQYPSTTLDKSLEIFSCSSQLHYTSHRRSFANCQSLATQAVRGFKPCLKTLENSGMWRPCILFLQSEHTPPSHNCLGLFINPLARFLKYSYSARPHANFIQNFCSIIVTYWHLANIIDLASNTSGYRILNGVKIIMYYSNLTMDFHLWRSQFIAQ